MPKKKYQAPAEKAAAEKAAAEKAEAVYDAAYQKAAAEQAAVQSNHSAPSDDAVWREGQQSSLLPEFDPTDVTYVPTLDPTGAKVEEVACKLQSVYRGHRARKRLDDLKVAVLDTMQGMIVNAGKEVETLTSSQVSVAETEPDRDTTYVNFRTIYLESMVNVILLLGFLLSVLAVVSVGMIIHKVVYTPPPPPPPAPPAGMYLPSLNLKELTLWVAPVFYLKVLHDRAFCYLLREFTEQLAVWFSSCFFGLWFWVATLG